MPRLGHHTFVRMVLAATTVLAVMVGLASPALAHEGEESVPAITDVQEAIAILAEHTGEFPKSEVVDHAADKVHDAMDSNDTRGVRLDLVKQADTALEAGRMGEAVTLLERSIGACPGAPVIEPENAPRTPPTLTSPCPSVPHLQALDRSPVGGAKEPILIALGAVLILAGLGLARRIR
ncbi:MAG TPA: hypothetical protein VEQ37_18280 [Actinomycetota bacterium]|nr:hypothetical protein [Actinomycetota bacterium]